MNDFEITYKQVDNVRMIIGTVPCNEAAKLMQADANNEETELFVDQVIAKHYGATFAWGPQASLIALRKKLGLTPQPTSTK